MLDRQARLLAALALVLSSAGACSLILPFGELQTGSTGSGGGAMTSTSAGTGGACEKQCNGKCVRVDDPEYGCTPTSCTACVAAWQGAQIACVGEECGQAPEVLAKGLASPWAVAVDDGGVYWSEEGVDGGPDGGVHRLAKEDGTATRLSTRDHARAIVLGQDQVFYTSFQRPMSPANGVWVVDKTTPNSEQKINNTLGEAEHQEGNIDLVGDRVFWSNDADGKVYSQELGSGPTVIHQAGSNEPHSLRIGNGKLFLSEIVGRKVEKMLIDGGMVTTFWDDPDPGPPSFLAIDANYLYVSGFGQQASIVRLTKSADAQTPVVIQAKAPGAGSIAVSGNYVYWAAAPAQGKASITRQRFDGMIRKAVLVNPRSPRGIAVDADAPNPALYYLEGGTPGHADGELVMLPLAAD